MTKEFWCKVIKNKKNGQYNLSLPKKKISPRILKEMDKLGKVKIKVK